MVNRRLFVRDDAEKVEKALELCWHREVLVDAIVVPSN